MNQSFYIPKLETRNSDLTGIPSYIIRGYATTPNNVYTYKVNGERSFREFFSERAIENIKKQAKSKKVFVDVEHGLATKESVPLILDQIKNNENKEQIEYVKTRLKTSDIPMFKVEDINIDDKGLFVEIRGNPFYRSYSEEHAAQFDSIWNSLQSGFINGMSLNFKPTETIQINDGLTQIDNIDIYGISLTGNPANDMASITEVAMRSLELVRGEQKCLKIEKKKLTTSLLM